THWLDSRHAVAVAATDAWIERRGWCAANALGATIARSTVTSNGRVYEIVRVRPPGGVPAEVWFDAITGLPERSVVRLNEDTRATYYADWREAAGTVWPFERKIVYVEDDDVTTLRASTIEPTTPPATAFDPPATKQTVTMLRGAASTTVPMHIEGRKMLVDVMLNGEGPFPMVFDTGGHFILSSATAKKLKLGVAGRGKDPENDDGFARVNELRIGDAVIRNDVAHVVPYSYARLERGPKPPKAGWLGLELLERFSVVIDPAKGTFTLTPRRAPAASYPGVRIPLVLDEDAPLAPCRIDGAPGECMIDTGNASPTIVEGHWSRAAGLNARFANGLDAGDGVRIARADLELGGIALPREIVAAFPPQHSGSESTTVEAAIVSETVHERYVTSIDYAQHAMWLAPIPGVTPPPYNRSGLQLAKKADGSFTVAFVLANSPAAAAGLKAGDRIVAIDGKPAREWTGADATAANLAPAGTQRTYTIRVPNSNQTRVVTLRLRDLLSP
ncbi:MAG TPA: PDZ domain-containing protein, partial [Candidatus Acidoferrales bacterium]|nr:PDZ domain-containing protein [Candidatus Acidoferrales bacterium]